MTSFWIICYPNGDRSRLAVAEVDKNCAHEMYDYDLASEKQYEDEAACNERAKELAAKNGLAFQYDQARPRLLE